MVYRANPFLERMSERTTSDQEFVRLFSPKILERLDQDTFSGATHIFRSPPGGGKTTLLRAFTPTALRAFWSASATQDESYRKLVSFGVLHEQDGPQLLGVFLSCAAGYADLPPNASMAQGLFRALLDCRVVLKTLRSLASLLGFSSTDQLESVQLEYNDIGLDLKSIPVSQTAADLVKWAEERERSIYDGLDSTSSNSSALTPTHIRFEGVLWLQAVRFIRDGKPVAPRRLLMIDDIQKLRKKQRSLLIEELVELRPLIPIWLSERSIALGDELLSQGSREGRDVKQYPLDDIWTSRGGAQQQFLTFAQNILDRRLAVQHIVPGGSFSQYLRENLPSNEIKSEFEKGKLSFHNEMTRHKDNVRYRDWIAQAESGLENKSVESLRDLYVTRILVARDESKRQLTLELAPLSTTELDERDNSQVQGAADIFIHEELKVPYYFGIDRLCAMATNNVEELLFLAAALYEGMQAKQILRKQADPQLSPSEQEKRIKDAAKRKRDFIPKNHTEGARAQRLLDSIGTFCREKTFQPNAPYAPGVTGIRLSQAELNKLSSVHKTPFELVSVLKKVLAECVAENLFQDRASAASTSREGGTVFYLNRTLCAHYGLPLNYGGWQDISVDTLIDWMERGLQPSRRRGLEGA